MGMTAAEKIVARTSGRDFLIRVEDLDRVRPGAMERQLDDPRRLGLTWDEGIDLTPDGMLTERGDNGPYTQSKRGAFYREYLERMLADGTAYWCYCTKEELDAGRAKLLETGGDDDGVADALRDAGADHPGHGAGGRGDDGEVDLAIAVGVPVVGQHGDVHRGVFRRAGDAAGATARRGRRWRRRPRL